MSGLKSVKFAQNFRIICKFLTQEGTLEQRYIQGYHRTTPKNKHAAVRLPESQ